MELRINYLESFDPAQIRRNFEMGRAPKDGSKRSLLILSNIITIVPTHWIGRTMPCTRPNCKTCDGGQLREIHGYAIVADARTEEKILWEFTAGPTSVLKEYQDAHGTIHGLGIVMGRKNDKPNGPQHLRIQKEGLNLAKFGLPPDVRPLLETMWRWNPKPPAEGDPEYVADGPEEVLPFPAAEAQSQPETAAGEELKKEVSKVKGMRRKAN